jgi:ubiquinol-cytochrome c reductase cytochrome b subunit
MIKVTRRTFAFTFAGLAAIGWAGLTAQAILTTPPEAPSAAVDYSVPTDWLDLRPEELAGISYFRQESCTSCHSLGEGPSKIGPDLTNTAKRRDAAWMIQHFKNPAALRPGTSMPSIQLNDFQLSALSAFILRLNTANASALRNAPDFAVQGALVYQSNRCGSCHKVNGAGAEVGPVLNGLQKRRSRNWVEEHFLDPKKLSPGSIMPPTKLPAKELENLTSYLLTLPDPTGSFTR